MKAFQHTLQTCQEMISHVEWRPDDLTYAVHVATMLFIYSQCVIAGGCTPTQMPVVMSNPYKAFRTRPKCEYHQGIYYSVPPLHTCTCIQCHHFY